VDGVIMVPGVVLVTAQRCVGVENRPDIDTGNVTALHHNMADTTFLGHLCYQILHLATLSHVKVMSTTFCVLNTIWYLGFLSRIFHSYGDVAISGEILNIDRI
jgi:hypothetical protein